MYRIKEYNKIENYCNIADYCYITIMNKAVCGKFPLEEECYFGGTFYIKCAPKNGVISIDEEGVWKYEPNCNYTGFDYFEILHCSVDGKKETFKIIISIASCKEAFKQISVQEYVRISNQKPDIEEILDVVIEVEIVHTHVFKTSKGRSYEGQNLTGHKLLVVGFLKQYIEYIADECRQSVHGAHFDVPFGTYIVLPEHYCEILPVNICTLVEDIFYQQIDKRCIFKNITLLLQGRTC